MKLCSELNPLTAGVIFTTKASLPSASRSEQVVKLYGQAKKGGFDISHACAEPAFY